MLYKQLRTDTIKLPPKAQIERDFGEEGAILLPNGNFKTFLHWLTDKGNVKSTFTMTYATRVTSKVRIINGSDTNITITVLTDW